MYAHSRPADVGRGPVPRGLVLDPCPTCTPQVTPQPSGPGSPFVGGEEPSGPVRQAASKDKVRVPCTLRSRCVSSETRDPCGVRQGGDFWHLQEATEEGRRGGSWLRGTSMVSTDSGRALPRRGHTCLPPPLRFHDCVAIMHLSLSPPNSKAALRDHVPGSPP